MFDIFDDWKTIWCMKYSSVCYCVEIYCLINLWWNFLYFFLFCFQNLKFPVKKWLSIVWFIQFPLVLWALLLIRQVSLCKLLKQVKLHSEAFEKELLIISYSSNFHQLKYSQGHWVMGRKILPLRILYCLKH